MCSCCNATFYGQTQRNFFVRASEYLGIAPMTGKFVKTPKKSVFFLIMLLDGHKGSFDNFSILFKERSHVINRSWTKIFTSFPFNCLAPFPCNCLIDYRIVTWYLLLFLWSHVNASLLYKTVTRWSCHSLKMLLVEAKDYLW